MADHWHLGLGRSDQAQWHHGLGLEAHGWSGSNLVNLLDASLDSTELGLQTKQVINSVGFSSCSCDSL